MDGIDNLLEYFLVFKEIEENNDNNKSVLKDINAYIEILENFKSGINKVKYIVNYDLLEKIVKKYDSNIILESIKRKYDVKEELRDDLPSYVKDIINSASKGIDSVLYDVMLYVNRYNVHLMNKKTRTVDPIIDKEITFDEIDVKLKDVLNYLDVNEEEIDKKLLSDLTKFADIEMLKNKAIQIKTDINLKKLLYDKVNDKNVLISILLHSELNTIKTIGKVFENNNVNISKIVGSIPSIFIKNPINSKCKYKVLTHYDNFMKNIELLNEFGLDFRVMLNYPVFLVNDFNNNLSITKKLQELGINIKNVLEHVANVFVIKPDIIFRNIEILNLYGISLTNDNNNNGYTLLGMEDLSDRLDYLIEKGLWRRTDGTKLDNIDLIRGLIIKDDYLKWKNNFKCDTLDSTSLEEFRNEPYNEEKLNKVFENNPQLKNIIENLDNSYLVQEEDYYLIGSNRVSRLRVLRNMSNYIGKDKQDVIIKSFLHKSNFNNSEELINALTNEIEMGDKGVKLS